ncbi:MAG: hypothetical protein EOO41_05540, partial [Methanobacteriota archaeon]
MSCFYDTHEQLIADGGLMSMLRICARASAYEPRVVVLHAEAAAAAAAAPPLPLSALRLQLEAGMLAASALCNIVSHPGSSVPALYQLMFSAPPSDDAPSSAGALPLLPVDAVRLLSRACTHAALLCVRLTLAARALTLEPVPLTTGGRQVAQARLEQIQELVGDAERAALLVDACVAIFSALHNAPALQLEATSSSSARGTGREAATLPFPYMHALVHGGAMRALHVVLACFVGGHETLASVHVTNVGGAPQATTSDANSQQLRDQLTKLLAVSAGVRGAAFVGAAGGLQVVTPQPDVLVAALRAPLSLRTTTAAVTLLGGLCALHDARSHMLSGADAGLAVDEQD